MSNEVLQIYRNGKTSEFNLPLFPLASTAPKNDSPKKL